MCKIIKCDTVVQSFSLIWLSVIPWTVTCHISLSFTISWSLLKCMSIESVMPTISSSVVPFSSCLHSFPASGSFPKSRLFTSDGQSIGTSASASVLPMNTQGLFPLGLTGLISLPSKGLSESTTLKLLLCPSIYIYQESYIFFHSFSNGDSSFPSAYFLIWDAI